MTHPIEAASYEILASRVDLSGWESGPRAVVERVIHASADLSFATSLVVPPSAVTGGVRAIERGAPVVVDAEMVRAGITNHPTVCLLGATPEGEPTRSAAAIRAAAAQVGDGAIYVIGCAPTALMELVALYRAGRLRPALVIGLPVGFVGAAESKDAARASGMPAITNVGEKGGSAVAAAAFNALRKLARSSPDSAMGPR